MMIIVSVIPASLGQWTSGHTQPEDGKAALQAKAKAKSRLKAKTLLCPKMWDRDAGYADSAEIGIDTWMTYRWNLGDIQMI